MIKIITKNLYGTTLTSGEAIAAESRTFEAKLRFGNVEHSGIYSFAYTSYISPQKFTLGSTSSAMFSCETASFKSGSSSALKGQVFTAIIYVAGSNEPIGLGEFKITEATEKDGIFSITAYDKMYFVKDKPYTPTIKGKRSLFNIFKDICTQIDNEGMGSGFTKTSPVSFSDTATLDTSVLSGYPLKEALGYLCAYAGRNCVVNRSGAFEARIFTAFKDYKLLNDDRIETPEIGESDLEIKSLTAVISDSDVLFSGSSEVGTLNFVCPIITQSRLNDLYSKDFALTSNAVHTFRTGKINQILGDPRLEVGDTIPLTHDGKTYNIPIMMIKLEFDGGLMSEIESYGLEEDSSISLAQKVNFALKKTKTEISKYAQASSELSGVIAGGLGLYKTEIADESGAVRTYMHDKPTLAGSSYIATFNSTGFAWTVSGWNGGNPNWSDGVDTIASNMVMRTISAHKITADMIDVSELSALNATIGGFCIAGGNTASNGFWDNSISSVIKTNQNKVDSNNPEYAVFLRGQSVDSDGNFHGAYDPNNVVFGVKKRVDSSKTWEQSTYTYYVSASGKLKATEADITGKITATSGKIAGFEIADENTAPSNGFWKNSLSSVNNDGDNYYAVFMRNGGSASNVAFGVKTLTKSGGVPSSSEWDGASYVFAVNNKGSLTATSGIIGGWKISSDTIYSDKSNYTVALCNFDNTNDNSRVLYCQKKSDESYTFRLYRNGALLATNADITGKITAASGEIGGFTITGARLYYNGWGIDNSVMLCPAGSTAAKSIGGSDSITGWTITSGANFGVTSSGELYASGARFSGNIICWDSSHRKRIGMNDGALAFSYGNSDLSAMYICGSILPIQGTYSSNGLEIVGRTAALGSKIQLLDQIKLYIGTYNALNLYNSDSGYGLDAKKVVFQVLRLSETSDERLKENIAALDKRYEKAFNLLLPCEFNFKGNGEKSVGFTAQQVQRAFYAANIDADGFVSKVDSDEQGMDGYQLSIGYTRFVALNTHMIQKCLSEIATLKAEIQSLKQKG